MENFSKKLIDNIPDISNQQIENINMIEYNNQEQALNIHNQAKCELIRLNDSARIVSNLNFDDSMPNESRLFQNVDSKPPNYFESELSYWKSKTNDFILPSAPTIN